MQYLELITNYQTNITILALLLISGIISGIFLYYTNDFKTTIITFLSTLLVPALVAITLFILYNFLKVEPSEKHTLITWSVLFLNTINLSTLIGKYAKEILEKGFDIDHVTRHHFKSTLNLFVTILLLGGASSVFVDTNMLLIIIPTVLITSITIWSNHLIARFLLREK